MIYHYVRPDKMMSWLRANASGSASQGTPKDCWKHYLRANSGGTGSINQMEQTFLRVAGATGTTLADAWNSYLAGLGKTESGVEAKARAYYQ